MCLLSVYDATEAKIHLYELLRERTADPTVNISHQVMPSFEQHCSFVDSEPYRHWYMIQTDWHEFGGMLYATRKNEIGIFMFKSHQNYGIARTALQKYLDEHKPLPAIPGERPGHFVANINPNNEASIKLFTGLGARHIQNTYQFD